MIDGLYAVNFKANGGDFGSGVVAIRGGAINGGDHGFFYQGALIADGSKVSTRLRVEKHNRAVQSIFGSMNSFELVLEGNIAADNSFSMSGSIAGATQTRILIHGRRIAELA